jgi:excisionase family DNA binding protein
MRFLFLLEPRAMPEAPPAPANYSIKSAATRIGCGVSTVRGLLAQGRLRRVPLGKKVLIPVVDVERLIDAMHDGSVKIEPRIVSDGEKVKNNGHAAKLRDKRAAAKAAKAKAT